MRMLRIADVCAVTGHMRTQVYAGVKAGLLPKGVPLGVGRAVAWPDTELEAINRARVAGKSNDEIRSLVKALEAQRTEQRAA